MRKRGRMRWAWGGAAVAALGMLTWALLAGVGRDAVPVSDGGQPTAPGGAVTEPQGPERQQPRPEDRDSSAADRPDPEVLAERQARATYRSYIKAINARAGEALCDLIEPGFLAELQPPVKRGSCAERIGESIGFADKRGFPVWEGTTLSGFESTLIGDGLRVQLSASIVTAFADREQPSVESDIVFLIPGPGDRYRLAKASGALWRAVGKPDIPPQVISPPPGF